MFKNKNDKYTRSLLRDLNQSGTLEPFDCFEEKTAPDLMHSGELKYPVVRVELPVSLIGYQSP